MTERSWQALQEKDNGRPMRNFLRNHAIRGFFTTKELRDNANEGVQMETLHGDELPPMTHSFQAQSLGQTLINTPILSLGKVNLGFKYDWRASNGIVHVIDYPLIPNEMSARPAQDFERLHVDASKESVHAAV